MFTSAEASAALTAVLYGAAERAVVRVNSDSRSTRAGDLFVAIKGEQFDGHQFVMQALQEGAVAALVDKAFAETAPHLPPDTALIVVDDTLLALGELAAWWRSRFSMPLIAVTGSNGKTSVKEMIAAILAYKLGAEAVLATTGNLNNHIGVPLMLLRLREQHQFVVLEMGMNHFDEIRYLTRMARPDVALVNNAGAAHLEFLGSLAGVARAKGEIYEGLAENGVAICNADDAFADYWRSLNTGRRMLGFGIAGGDVTAQSLAVKPLSSQFTLRTPQSAAEVILQVPGLHNVRNALAAAAAALVVGLSTQEIAAGLNSYAGTKGRLQQKRATCGALVIDDTYNANPDSMRAAVDVLASLPTQRILVLGDMGEIGSDIAEKHRELGAYARQAGINYLLATGEAMRHAVAAFGEQASWYADHAALIADLRTRISAEVSVLCKGSRFMRMEQVVQALTEAGKVGA